MQYKVSTDQVSMHCPLQRLLAGFVIISPEENLATLLGLEDDGHTDMDAQAKQPTQDRKRVKLDLDFVGSAFAILEPALRMQVLMAQINSRMWVRNGISMRNLAYNYCGFGFRLQVAD